MLFAFQSQGCVGFVEFTSQPNIIKVGHCEKLCFLSSLYSERRKKFFSHIPRKLEYVLRRKLEASSLPSAHNILQAIPQTKLVFGLMSRAWNYAKGLGRSFLIFAGRFTARLPKRILRHLVGGFVKELKSRKLDWEELHYIIMHNLTLEDIYQLIINDHSLNQTSTEYGGIVNFLDAKAKLEATKILPDLDKDKDGDVSPREVLDFLTEAMSSRLSHAIKTIDADGDGFVGVSDILTHLSDVALDTIFRQMTNGTLPIRRKQ